MRTGWRGGAARVVAWLAAALLCLLAGHASSQESGPTDRQALAALPNNQATEPISSSSSNSGDSLSLFVPVILAAPGQNDSFFTSELTLTNRGGEEATLHLTYTAHTGGGSGTATDRLIPGQQKITPDALEYLRQLGMSIPHSDKHLGTLRVEVSGSSEVGVSVRTTTRVPDGRAGLAYPGISADSGFAEAVYLCGLRQNSQDRSNVAFQNMGTSQEGPITLRTTLFSGDPEVSEGHVLEDRILEPGGFHQYNGILNRAGFDNGYVKVERVEGEAPFYAYGVINDNFNSDGSFVFPVTESFLEGTMGQTLPVILETEVFTSELMVTNFSDMAKTVTLLFRAEAVETPDKTATLEWTLQPGQQVIVPDIVEVMRQRGTAGIGPSGQTIAGALFVTVVGGDMSGIVIGARTSASDGGGGRYGVFYHAVPDGEAFTASAWIDALQQNEENRSNLALVNTGDVDTSPSIFQLDIYDGVTGRLAHTVTGLTVAARGWRQVNGILAKYAPGTTQGHVRIRKISGNNPFLAYGVINDGGAPGERSGDGAYLLAVGERIHDPGTEPMTDREVLEVLYHATGGPGWTNHTNWLSDAPLSEWYGVETDSSGRVTKLDLSHNVLSGTIPPELGQLTQLQHLDLARNGLSGTIPPEMAKLARLQWLGLGTNRLSGVIPLELGRLTQLRDLYLNENRLSGVIPPQLGSLTRLRVLSLNSNQLIGTIPPELGGLTELYWLKLGDNQLTGTIPPGLGRLTRLRILDLGSNRLSGTIPPQLGKLTNLERLSLGGNELSGAIPPQLAGLTNLESISVYSNPLSGAIPKTLQQLSNLEWFDFVNTGICVPADATFQTWLNNIRPFVSSRLVCDGTRRVSFSASSYQVREGETITVSVRLIDHTGDTDWSAEIALTARPDNGAGVADYAGVPERVTITAPATEASFGVTALEDSHFDPGETVVLGFRRPLPAGLIAGSPDTAAVTIRDPTTEGLTNREVLEALYHATGGPKWGNRTHWLSDGPLSEWFGVDTDRNGQVISLDLSINELSGTIPPALGQLERLQSLNLRWNQLSGGIPPELGGLTQLRGLDLSHNELSGTILPALGQLERLQSLILSGNQLSGAIPPELGGLTHLQELDLRGNELSGEIPPELGGLTHLQGMDLSFNRLIGGIPLELGGLIQLQRLFLGVNQLSGEIPPELGGLTQLRELDLESNELSGAIPPELGGMTQRAGSGKQRAERGDPAGVGRADPTPADAHNHLKLRRSWAG